MRAVPPLDLLFTVLHALLLSLAGAAVWLASGTAAAALLALALPAAYLAVVLPRLLRRRRAARALFPGEWRAFLLERSPYYRGLEKSGRERFERDVRLFLAETRIAGTGGAPVAWTTRLLVGAAAATMLHGRPQWEPPLRDGVTVYPGHVFDREYRPGRGTLAGQAPAGGPLLVAEKSLIEGFAGEHDGFNVMIHELAHYFDLEARRGRLRITADRDRPAPWGEAVAGAYARHDFASSPLPAYAAQNEAEFFACASEMFFEAPRPLAAACPRLFALLAEFYGQDPRGRLPADSGKER
ncbi:MAG TPA: zinc-dependent peptidase [Candidatus Aminicenantes bacterium]|nr:zinc-dependent peptidase [Candidatus Aminicenantes bacterium]